MREERRDVVTRGVNNQYVVKYNDFDYVHYFINKVDFNEKFSKYLGRDWLFVKSADQRDEFAEFIKGKEDFILKPVDGTHGDGVAKLPGALWNHSMRASTRCRTSQKSVSYRSKRCLLSIQAV